MLSFLDVMYPEREIFMYGRRLVFGNGIGELSSLWCFWDGNHWWNFV